MEQLVHVFFDTGITKH